MNTYYSSHFISKYKRLSKKDKQTGDIIKSKVALFISDKNNLSLRLHKLQGNLRMYWSISIKTNLRVVFSYVNEDILFIDIGSHDEVYK